MAEVIDFDKLDQTWQYQDPYFIIEREVEQNTGLNTKSIPGKELRRGKSITVMDASNLERAYWQKTVWETPLPYYEKRLDRARKIARHIIEGRTIIELSRIP